MRGKSHKRLRLTWFGHSAFLLESSAGPRILIDPWVDNPRAPQDVKATLMADLILVTHGHGDHVGNTIELAARTGAKVVAIHEVALFLRSQGVEAATGMNKGGAISFDGVRVTMVDARHSSAIDTEPSVIPGGEAAAYIVRFGDGFSIYHAGDTSVFGDMRYIRQLHRPRLSILPIGDLYTMGPREAAIACQLLKSKYFIGMHYGTFPALTGTPALLRKHLPAKVRASVLELDPGVPVELS